MEIEVSYGDFGIHSSFTKSEMVLINQPFSANPSLKK